MLKRFLNPPWLNPDESVRREAVAALTWDSDPEALAQVARADAVPALRSLAVGRCRSLDLVRELAERDGDDGVRERATRRYRELLAGPAQEGPAVSERLQVVNESEDGSLTEFIARTARDETLRGAALAKVTREPVLRDVALGDPSPQLRLAALERIQDEAMIARVYERSRRNDKRVSRRARERLDALKAERERPRQVEGQCQQIITSLEHLGRDGRWEHDEAVCQQLEARWGQLEPELRQAFEEHFNTARSRFLDDLASFRKVEAPILAAKEALIERVESLLRPVADGATDGDAWAQERESLLRELGEAWTRTQSLPQVEEEALQRRFRDARSAVQEALIRHRHDTERARLIKEHERLIGAKGVVAEREVKNLERAMDRLPARAGDSGLEARLDKVHRKLRDRLRQQAAWKEETLSTLPARLDALKSALAEGQGGDAVALHDAIASDLDGLASAGTSTERLADLRRRLKPLSKEAEVMRAWSRFGADRTRERLCEEMEALKDGDHHPAEIGRQVRAARDAWKELARGPGRVDQALWTRFDGAASEAWKRFKAHQDEQAGQRRANLGKRRGLLQELQDFLASASGGPDMDWKAAVRLRRSLLDRWRNAHPVERKAGKPLGQDFDARLADLDALMTRERERCLQQREQLIGKAEELAGSEDKKAAADACKGLQRQWAVTVPGSRGQENALWERFRGACDAVFAGRNQVFDKERGDREANLSLRKDLCQRVEALCARGMDELDEAERELHRTQGEWAGAGPAPRNAADKLDRRFRDAVKAFKQHQRALQARAREADLDLMLDKSGLCHEAECLAVAQERRAAAVQALRGRWQALAALANEEDEQRMTARFEQALSDRAGIAGADDASGTPRPDNQVTRESLCLRMEILAGVDSPPEHAQARMAWQVNRLASALGRQDGAAEDTPAQLVRQWCVTGPAPVAAASALEARFTRARGALRTSSGDPVR